MERKEAIQTLKDLIENHPDTQIKSLSDELLDGLFQEVPEVPVVEPAPFEEMNYLRGEIISSANSSVIALGNGGLIVIENGAMKLRK